MPRLEPLAGAEATDYGGRCVVAWLQAPDVHWGVAKW